MSRRKERQNTQQDPSHQEQITRRRNLVLFSILLVALIVFILIIASLPRSPAGTVAAGVPSATFVSTLSASTPTINPTLIATFVAWSSRSQTFRCDGGEQIIYLGIFSSISDRRMGLTNWREIPAGATTDDLLRPNFPPEITAEIKKIANPGQYRAMIISIGVNYTISNWATMDLIHTKQLNGYVEALCWLFHNQELVDAWRVDLLEKETLLDGLAFISTVKGKTPDETLNIYRSLNLELVAAGQAHWVRKPWTQQDSVSCEMLNFIDWLSRTSAKGITISAKEPARAMIQPGGLPLDHMKCDRVTQS
jgi:hypothetical protein